MIKRIIAFIALLSYILCSCKTLKDNNAFARVIGDSSLSERAYQTLEKSHPCAIADSAHISYGNISIINDTTATYDTTRLNTTDTIVISDTIHITRKIQSRDTITISSIDTRRLDLANTAIANQTGQIMQLNVDITAAQKKSDLWFYLFCASIGIGIIRIIVKYAFKIAWL